MLTPLFNRVIIKPEPKRDKIASGIVLNSTYDKTEELHGTVVAIGKDCEIVKVGDMVSYPAYGYDSVSENDGSSSNLMSVREPEILAIITPNKPA